MSVMSAALVYLNIADSNSRRHNGVDAGITLGGEILTHGFESGANR